jgi:hypothetical protein
MLCRKWYVPEILDVRNKECAKRFLELTRTLVLAKNWKGFGVGHGLVWHWSTTTLGTTVNAVQMLRLNHIGSY